MKKLLLFVFLLLLALPLTGCKYILGSGSGSGGGGGSSGKERDAVNNDGSGESINGENKNDDNDDGDGKDPSLPVCKGEIMEFAGTAWLILEERDDKVLLLSEFSLFPRKYHTENEPVTWAECELRSYLNNTFINEFFTEKDRNRIIETVCVNKSNQWHGTSGGADTLDKIFLLSLDEVVRYFGNSGQLYNRPGEATSIDDEYNSNRITLLFNEKGNHATSTWMLRSPGRETAYGWNYVSGVEPDGQIVFYIKVDEANRKDVRPALWITLDK